MDMALHAIITKTEPLQSCRFATITPSNSVLTDMTNTKVTPERLATWIPDLDSALIKWPNGVGACSAVAGEPEEIEIILEKAKCLEDFKIRMVQRELIVELYRDLGNVRSEYSSDSEYIVGRNQFYLEFLKSNKNALQRFLLDSNPVSSTPVFGLADALRILEPTNGILRTANQMAHDLTYNDIFVAISLLERQGNSGNSEARKWESLVIILTGKGCMLDWNGNSDLIKEDCMVQRVKMAGHTLRLKSETFESKRVAVLKRKHFRDLEKDGHVVTRQTLDDIISQRTHIAAGAISVASALMALVIVSLWRKVERLTG